MTDFRKKIAMKLFNDTYDMGGDNEKKSSALEASWQSVDVISSNCPVHIGVRLGKLSDNTYQCPKGQEVYKAKSNIANQTSKDRYDIGISIK